MSITPPVAQPKILENMLSIVEAFKLVRIDCLESLGGDIGARDASEGAFSKISIAGGVTTMSGAKSSAGLNI